MPDKMFDINEFRNQELPKEAELMANWHGSIEEPIVSIACAAYNHEMYIEDALKGFLIQKTNFPFEILIHDDASTDKTADIIRRYQELYPKIIKPIYQTVNQYSQKIKIGATYNYPRAKGEYIAICEGDDFWIDENKLQNQYDSLLKYPGVNICFTSGLGLTSANLSRRIANYGEEEKIFDLSSVIIGGGAFMPTASLFLHKDILVHIPDWFNKALVGDYYIQILGSLNHGALYLPYCTTIYRLQSQGSWSSNRNSLGENDIIKELESGLYCMERAFKEPKYKNELQDAKAMLYYVAAHDFAENGFYAQAKEHIVLSWEIKPKLSRIQSLLYKARFTLPLALLLIYIHSYLKNVLRKDL